MFKLRTLLYCLAIVFLIVGLIATSWVIPPPIALESHLSQQLASFQLRASAGAVLPPPPLPQPLVEQRQQEEQEGEQEAQLEEAEGQGETTDIGDKEKDSHEDEQHEARQLQDDNNNSNDPPKEQQQQQQQQRQQQQQPSKRRVAFVCITGVLGDLELANKMQHLLVPLHNHPQLDNVQVAILLQNDTADSRFIANREPHSFSMAAAFRGGRYNESSAPLTQVMNDLYKDPFGPDVWKPVYESEHLLNLTRHRRNQWMHTSQEIQARFQRLLLQQQKIGGGNVTAAALPTVQIYPPLIDPPINMEYMYAVSQRDAFEPKDFIRRDEFERIGWRSVNDARKLDNLQRCWTKWLQQKVENATGEEDDMMNDDSSIVIAVGEDSILSQSIDVDQLLLIKKDTADGTKSSSSSSVTSLPCHSLRGFHNDQIDVVPLSWAKEYFVQPLERWHIADTFQHPTMSSLSQYLQHVYQTLGSYRQQQQHQDTQQQQPGETIPYPLTMPDRVGLDRLTAVHNDVNVTLGQLLQQQKHHPEKQSRNQTALVCITGQLGRLEMANKVKTLIQPLQEAGFSVDVAFVLSGGKAHFQLKKVPNATSAMASLIQEGHAFETEDDLRNFAQRLGIHVITNNDDDGGSKSLLYEPIPNQPFNPQYMIHLLRNGGFAPTAPYSFHKASPYRKVLSQVRANGVMFKSYSHCWDQAVRHQQKQQLLSASSSASSSTTTTLPGYDLYVRLRDDAGFLHPIRPMELLHDMTRRTMITPRWKSNGGINDRLAFVGRDAAKCYFNLPYVKFYSGHYLHHAQLNSESYFKGCYVFQDGPKEHHCTVHNVRKHVVPQKLYHGNFLDGMPEAHNVEKDREERLALNQTEAPIRIEIW